MHHGAWQIQALELPQSNSMFSSMSSTFLGQLEYEKIKGSICHWPIFGTRLSASPGHLCCRKHFNKHTGITWKYATLHYITHRWQVNNYKKLRLAAFWGSILSNMHIQTKHHFCWRLMYSKWVQQFPMFAGSAMFTLVLTPAIMSTAICRNELLITL